MFVAICLTVLFKPRISHFYTGGILGFMRRQSVADALGNIVDSVGKAFDSVNNIVDTVGNRLHQQGNKVMPDVISISLRINPIRRA